ncbi:6-phosphogluconolactonase [soil metagenome]
MTGFQAELRVSADPAAVADDVAAWLLGLALARPGRFSLCLSGGSTPKALYERLAAPPYRDAFPWDRTHLFWGDERFVPADDPLSNYAMVKAALLDHVAISAENVHPVPTEHLDPQAAATAYEAALQAFYGREAFDPAEPLFDVNLLGVGPDGHTASLFPGTAVLEERDRWVAAVIGAKAEARITLTYPALESSRRTAFLVVGADKAPILARLRAGDPAVPAAHLRPCGDVLIFSDPAAVSTG